MGTDDRNEPMELVAYGVFRQDFYAMAKQYGKYVLHRMIPIPDCGFCSEHEIMDHIRQFEGDTCSKQYVFERQEDCIRQLLSEAEGGTEGRGQAEAGGAVFTCEEFLLLSCGLLSMENGIEQAMKIAGYDHDMHYAALKAMGRCKDLNAKVCGMAGQSCN